ncbi:unnamed protein product [Nippostrongylus brasiliensis]|uniref:Uncharacterized protein n=1 Tax=Nippostrongylus brasiliensis TaxID=27835 RepID=A0A0N4YVD5_NIPBR|nr:unnamed protein product [Nippostrongylus brasiliensis]
MSVRAVLVVLVVAMVLALCQALPIDANSSDYGSVDNYFYLSPRLVLLLQRFRRQKN